MSRILKAYDRSIFSFLPNFLTVSFPIEEGFTGSDGPEDDPVNDPDGLAQAFENADRILVLLSENPKLSYDELADRIGISRSTVKREIKKLRENAMIKRVGSDKAGRWEILDTSKKSR